MFKSSMITMNQQIFSLKRQKLLRMNQMVILEMKNAITDMRNFLEVLDIRFSKLEKRKNSVNLKTGNYIYEQRNKMKIKSNRASEIWITFSTPTCI